MKKLIITIAVGLLIQQATQAQGTLYLSNLGQASTGSAAIGSDSWLAAGFETGNNADGYLLDSVQLEMANAFNNPNGFTVMLYTQSSNPSATIPGSNLATLDGSDNPSTGGIYTYTPDSNLTLSPNTFYFIVLTAGTATANGDAYDWIESAYPPTSNSGWEADNTVLYSNNGISGWSPTSYLGIAQFAISATAVPEPGILSLAAAGGVFLLWRQRKTSNS